MTVEILKVGVVNDTEWQGDLRLWAEYGDEFNLQAARVGSNQYGSFQRLRYQGMKEARMDRYDEFPTAEVSGARFNARWLFTRIPARWQAVPHRFGWVQNVKRDVASIRYSTRSELVIPTAEWAPEGINANRIWYLEDKEVCLEDGTEMPDRPTCDVPLFCPRTGEVPDSVEFSRRIELRDWLVVMNPATRAMEHLFHFDWAMTMRMEFERVQGAEGQVLQWTDTTKYRQALRYRWKITAPGSGLIGETLTTDGQVRLGMGEQHPRSGRSNETAAIEVRQLA